MGLTESKSKQQEIQNNHKLIRRFTSDAYGDLTVVQNKTDKSMWALRQLIIENMEVERLIGLRRSMNHRSLVALREYWFQYEESLCSNLRNTSLLFEYFPRTLEEQIILRSEKDKCFFGDWEILQILGDCLDCLKYLESMNFLHLITSLRSILYDPVSETVKIVQNIEMALYSHKNKKINIMGLNTNKKFIPLHPSDQPRETCDSCIDQVKVAHQNIFVLCLMCLSLCFLTDLVDLGIITKSGYDFKKINKRINQISKKFPNTHKVVSSLMISISNPMRYIDALKEISYERRSFLKQNKNCGKQDEIKLKKRSNKVQKIQKKTTNYLKQAKINLDSVVYASIQH